MVIDGRSLSPGETLEAEVCVIGAGAAGITLARESAGRPFRVVLLEAGGFDPDGATQAAYRGEITGRPYFPLEACRLRYFGGSTNHWAGWCRPLDPEDFAIRDWVPNSGWPFPRATLDPYYERAHAVCELGSYRYDVEYWARQLAGAPLSFGGGGSRVETRIFQFSPRTAFGRRYRQEVTRAPNVQIVLHGSVTELEAAPEAASLRSVRVRTLAGNEFRVRARLFVLATGGITNAQLLLASRSTMPAGLGNQHDLVGRYFMEHPHHNEAGLLLPTGGFRTLPFYERHTHQRPTAMGVLVLTDEARRRERLLHLNLSFHSRRREDAAGYASLKHLARSVLRREMPTDLTVHLRRVLGGLDEAAGGVVGRLRRRTALDYYISWRSEQVPNPSSRVLLADERDPFGVPRARLEWRLTAQDLGSIRRTQEIVAAEIGRAGIGRIRLPDDDGSRPWSADLIGGSHHMGTTRMASDPKRGVVDQHARVHGIGNLYVAGSSVFPTSGSANPTLTIVALALRLADRIREELR